MQVITIKGTKHLEHRGEQIALDTCECKWLTMNSDAAHAPPHGYHDNSCPTEESYFAAQEILEEMGYSDLTPA